MAYPFFQMPTLDEFISRVCKEFQVEQKETKTSLKGPRGTEKIKYLFRNVEGNAKIAVVPNIPGSTRLIPSKLRSMCDALNIPRAKFGFKLDMVGEDDPETGGYDD